MNFIKESVTIPFHNRWTSLFQPLIPFLPSSTDSVSFKLVRHGRSRPSRSTSKPTLSQKLCFRKLHLDVVGELHYFKVTTFGDDFQDYEFIAQNYEDLTNATSEVRANL